MDTIIDFVKGLFKPKGPPMAGYIVGSIVWAKEKPSPDMLKDFAALMKATDESFGAEKIYVGPADKQYEMGAGKPNVTFIVKFASAKKAKEFYEAEGYTAWRGKYVDGKLGRDLRCIEAPANTFEAGKSYWFGLIHNTVDEEKFGKYAGAVFGTPGFVPGKLAIKFAGPSYAMYEEALTNVPSKEDAKAFAMGLTCDQGIVVVAEIVDGKDAAAVFHDVPPYANMTLKAFGDDLVYTTPERYEELMERFPTEVLKRDVRIVTLPEVAAIPPAQ